ncbi:MAG: diguanylate cyclase [Polyangiaceae bacterium]
MTTRITMGPPLVGAPLSSDAPISVAYGERHGEGARQVTVLAVVTDPAAAELFERVLSRDKLVVAGDMAEGIALAEAESPEVVFIDVGVADGAGLALVHHIKVVAPNATIFAMAAPEQVASGAHAVALGAAGLFVLPLGGDEVLNAVHAVRARLVEKTARAALLRDLRSYARANDWVRRMVELGTLPDWEAVATEVADVFVDATGAEGAAVYVTRDERPGELAQRAMSASFPGAPLFGSEPDLIEHARREQLTVVRLGARKETVGMVLLAGEGTADAGVPSVRGGSLDGFVRLLATQAATAFALRVERERSEGGALMKDPTSSAYSFAYYVDVAGREIDRARRFGRRFSIATIVLEGATSTSSEEAAPETAVPESPRAAEVGDRLLSAVTDIDVVARVDKDEFHLLLPETDGLAAHAVRRRILARLAASNERRAVPRGVLTGVATFPHDGRDLAQLLRVARRRADATGSSIVHKYTSAESTLAELCGVPALDHAAPGDPFATRLFMLPVDDAVALATTAVAEALRGGSALIVVTYHADSAIGAAVRAQIGSGREGVTLHAIDASGAAGAPGVEALAVFAEHGAFAMVGKSDGRIVRGHHAADPLFVDLVADRIGRAAGVRVLG